MSLNMFAYEMRDANQSTNPFDKGEIKLTDFNLSVSWPLKLNAKFELCYVSVLWPLKLRFKVECINLNSVIFLFLFFPDRKFTGYAVLKTKQNTKVSHYSRQFCMMGMGKHVFGVNLL